MAKRFRANRQVRAQLVRQPGVQAMLRHNAEAVKLSAERESPIGDTADYIHGFVITVFPIRVRVGNTDFFAHLVEWGSVNNPPYAPLRRGVRAAGLRLEAE